MKKELSLIHTVQGPRIAGKGRAPLLLLLHGLGDSEAGLMGLASSLDGRFFCVSARAPHPFMGEGFAWFHVDFSRGGRSIDSAQAEESRRALLAFIDELVEAYDLDPKRVAVAGFSQGAIMGLGLALTAPEKLCALVAMSGRLLPEFQAGLVEPGRLSGLPVFIAHGIHDEVIGIQEGRAAKAFLSGLPVRLEYHEYAMGHEISSESLGDIAAWLHGRLGD